MRRLILLVCILNAAACTPIATVMRPATAVATRVAATITPEVATPSKPASTYSSPIFWWLVFEHALPSGFWSPGINHYRTFAVCSDPELQEHMDGWFLQSITEFPVDTAKYQLFDQDVGLYPGGMSVHSDGITIIYGIHPLQRTRLRLILPNMSYAQAEYIAQSCLVYAIVNDGAEYQLLPLPPTSNP